MTEAFIHGLVCVLFVVGILLLGYLLFDEDDWEGRR